MKETLKAILLIPVALYIAIVEGWNDFHIWRSGDGGDWDEVK